MTRQMAPLYSVLCTTAGVTRQSSRGESAGPDLELSGPVAQRSSHTLVASGATAARAVPYPCHTRVVSVRPWLSPACGSVLILSPACGSVLILSLRFTHTHTAVYTPIIRYDLLQ